MNYAGKFILGVIFYSIFAKMWFFLMLPGRFLARWAGFGSSLGWMVTMVAAVMLIHGGIKTAIHAGRNAYIEAFVPDRVPVPLNLKHYLLLGLRVHKSTEYLDTYASSQNGILHMTVTNNTKYPLTKMWFVCKVHGRLIPDSYTLVNTEYLFDGVMPPGQTRSTDVVFEGPTGGDYMTECELRGAEVPYGWWEGIPREATERQEGRGPSRLYNRETFGVVSEGAQGRPRLFLDDELNPTADPLDGVVDRTPIWGDEAQGERRALVFDYEASTDSDGLVIDVSLTNHGRDMVSNVSIYCLIQTQNGVLERGAIVFPMGVNPGVNALDSVLIVDVIEATGIACELGEYSA